MLVLSAELIQSTKHAYIFIMQVWRGVCSGLMVEGWQQAAQPLLTPEGRVTCSWRLLNFYASNYFLLTVARWWCLLVIYYLDENRLDLFPNWQTVEVNGCLVSFDSRFVFFRAHELLAPDDSCSVNTFPPTQDAHTKLIKKPSARRWTIQEDEILLLMDLE